MRSLSRSCNLCSTENPSQATFCMSCGGPMEGEIPLPGNATGLLQQHQLLKQRYRILAQVGRGGFAAVYKAEDLHFYTRLVALKEMSQSGLSPQERAAAIDAFTREAQLLASLQHPHLPRIYDHFTQAGRWYLVMDFLEGETLEHVLQYRPDQRLSLQETLDTGLQLCSVLDYLHTRQPPIIFRDLKPSNIMRAPSGHLYLIDFGIARHFKPGQAKDTIPFGSPGYAAPEQYGKAQTTPQSDIYSLGVLLHHLLSGEDPSERPFLLAPLRLAGSQELSELERLIERMTHLDAGRRPASIAEVQAALQALAGRVSQKPGSIFTLPAPPNESRAPERSSLRERPGQIQEQVFERPVNRTRRRLVIGGVLTGVAIAAGAGSLLTLFHASPTPLKKLHPTPLPVGGFPDTNVMFGFDAQHTRFNTAEHLLSPANVSRLVPGWSVLPDGGFTFPSSPTVSGDTLYIVSDEGRLHAYEAATGQIRWVADPHYTANSSTVCTPAVVDGIVYVCMPDERLYAYDAYTGKLRWSSPASIRIEVNAPATVVDGVVYVTGGASASIPADHDRVYAFDATTGRLRWVSDSTPGFSYSSPSVANGMVFVSVSIYDAIESRVYAFEVTTGRQRWVSQPINWGIDANAASTAVANGLVYIGTGLGGLVAYDVANGRSRWASIPNGDFASGSSPALADGKAYISLIDGRVYALDALSGKVLWTSASIGASAGSSPLVANGVLYVGSAGIDGVNAGSVYALDITNGHALWSSPVTGDTMTTAPIVANGMLFFVSGSSSLTKNPNGRLYAYHLPQPA